MVNAMPRRAYPLGITVNLDGRRFTDEGAGFAEQTFVDMGRRIMREREGVAFQIFDGRSETHIEERYGSAQPIKAGSVAELAGELGIDAAALERTVREFNEARPHWGVRSADHGRERHASAGPAKEQLGD